MSQLIPRVFLIEQEVNDYTYYVQLFNFTGVPRWYITLGIQDPCYWTDRWKEGFETPEEALEAWQQHYERLR